MGTVQYHYPRALELEGRHPHDVGSWPLTVRRLEIGEGLPQSNSPWAFINVPDGGPIPPTQRPPDEVLWRNFYYRRIRSSAECDRHMFSAPQSLPSIACHLTLAWADPPGGNIPLPSAEDRLLPDTHAARLIARLPDRHCFQFRVLWKNWGDNSTGYMPYAYFDRYVFECLAGYGLPEALRRFQLKNLDDKGLVRWTAFDEEDHRIYAFEVRDRQFKGRHAWAFVIERDGALEVEEMYVRPEYRRRGHGKWLADRVAQLAREKGMPLRLWVAFADCKSESEANYPALVATAHRLGVQFQPSTVRWAAYFGTTEHAGAEFPVEPLSIPRRPRAPRAAVLAATLALASEMNATNGRHPSLTTQGQVSAGAPSETFPKPGTPEWGRMNQRRAELIRRDISCQLNPAEQVELERLQRLSLAAVDEAFPYPQQDGERERELDERLRRQGVAGE